MLFKKICLNTMYDLLIFLISKSHTWISYYRFITLCTLRIVITQDHGHIPGPLLNFLKKTRLKNELP